MSEKIKNDLMVWLKNKNNNNLDLDFDSNVIESGVISSLDIMELILFVEQLKGEKFNLKNIKPGSFNSVNSIYKSFFGN